MLGLMIPNAFAVNVPDWIKNTAGWWATDAISETEFVNAIEFLVNEDIIQVSVTQTLETSQGVPDWIKNTAGWWATDAISETEFVNAIAYLIKNGIISIESSKSPEIIADMWLNGQINDDEFLTNVEQLIEAERIIIPDSSIIETSQLPDWLVNNAAWWAARIITNSDFHFDPDYVNKELYPCIEFSPDVTCFSTSYNSYGFRGNEFQEYKHDVDFRIFAVGGSTTFGPADDGKTWPDYLQQIMNENISGKKIEVINTGTAGATSDSEYGLIKNILSTLDPDLIIMYDGWNDHQEPVPLERTIQNWESVCKLGEKEGFDTMVVVQPLTISGNRVLTDQEITNTFLTPTSDTITNFGFNNNAVAGYVEKSQQYVNAFRELGDKCAITADFRKIFDYIQAPIFYDAGHTLSFGNEIIAQNMFSVISPAYFDQEFIKIFRGGEKYAVYAVSADLSGRNFDNLNLQNAVFDKADLSNTSFNNADIDGARFAFANLSNSNLLDRIDLSNVNLAGIDLSKDSLKGKDLSHANLSYVDLSEHDLTGTNLSDTFLLRTNLSGVDLRNIPLTNADFRYAYLSESKLPDSLLVNNNFDYAHLKNINFAGKDLSDSSFQQAELNGSDMQNTDLRSAKFIQVDFTKIKNKSLAGTDLRDAVLAHSNLSGVNLADAILQSNNFWNADLSGVDFSVISKATVEAGTFLDTDLSNSNFEGLDLSPQQQFQRIFEDKAYLIRGVPETQGYEKMILDALFGEYKNMHLISAEVSGNDLAVTFIFYNNFALANLENANFKNAKLWNVNFHSANLTNADLSGADLSMAYLGDADLSNANLDGAILNGAILTCKNHSVCN